MEKDDGVKKVAAAVAVPAAAPEKDEGVKKVAVEAPEKEPETQEKCYKKRVAEEATFLETAKDYFNQFKEIPAQKHWICLKNYFNQKYDMVFCKQKVEPVVKDETLEVAKPAAAAVESP